MYPFTNWNSALESNSPLFSRPSSYRPSPQVSNPPPYMNKDEARTMVFLKMIPMLSQYLFSQAFPNFKNTFIKNFQKEREEREGESERERCGGRVQTSSCTYCTYKREKLGGVYAKQGKSHIAILVCLRCTISRNLASSFFCISVLH